MRILNQDEFQSEINSGTGYIHFMCGQNSKNGKQIIDVNGILYLFMPEEIGNNEYTNLMKMQELEGKEYCDMLTCKKTMSRYFIDKRVGCIAIRDRQNTDPEYQGLHSDTPGVVEYWPGTKKPEVCSKCGSTTYEWHMPEEIVKHAELVCEELNIIEKEKQWQH